MYIKLSSDVERDWASCDSTWKDVKAKEYGEFCCVPLAAEIKSMHQPYLEIAEVIEEFSRKIRKYE